jgi:hypothetical protein
MENLEYITRNIEPRITKAEKKQSKEITKILEIPLGDIDWKEKGGASIENDKLKITLTYNPSEHGKNWRTLTSLELSIVSGENHGTVNLLEDLNPETNISVGIKNYSGFKGYNREKKEILFDDNFLTPKGLIQLLHEIGHSVRSESIKNIDQEGLSFIDWLTVSKFSSKEKVEKLAKKYRDERDAHAYAIKKLKPLIRQDILPKEAVMALIHDDALQTYSAYLRGITEGALQSLWNDNKELFEK